MRSLRTRPTEPPLSISATLRLDLIRRVLDRVEPRTILEIGCGQGALGSRLARRAAYLGVEPDDASYAVAHERIAAAGGEVLHGTDDDVPEGRQFDVVCAFEVLEHIEDDVAALARWRDRTRPRGHLVLSVPAHRSRYGAMDEFVGHFRRYDPPALERLLRDAGFDEVDVRLYGWPIGYALEAVRNGVAARRSHGQQGSSVAERTAASGRLLQPRDRAAALAIRVGTAPFRLTQRLRPTAGVGVVAAARRPD